MKFLIIAMIFTLLPFLNETGIASYEIYAQQEEIMEEESTPAKAKETPKPEVKKEEKKAGENAPAVPQSEPQKVESPLQPTETPMQEEDPFKDDSKKQIPERLKYFKEKYEDRFDKPFEVVWNAIKKSVTELPCQIATENYKATDEGLYKGVIKSDFCVFTTGKDTTFDVLKRFSLELPIIRGGRWENGRMQYTCIVKEEAGGSVYLQIKGELSGFEEFVTHEVHFWKSNGLFEHLMFERIKKNIDEVLKN